MDAAKIRRRFTEALAGGMGADWYDAARHNADEVGARFLAGKPVCAAVTSSHRLEEAREVSRPYFDRIQLEARRRGVPGY